MQQLYFISLFKTTVGVNVSALSFARTYFGTVCFHDDGAFAVHQMTDLAHVLPTAVQSTLWSSGDVGRTCQAPGIADIAANDSRLSTWLE